MTASLLPEPNYDDIPEDFALNPTLDAALDAWTATHDGRMPGDVSDEDTTSIRATIAKSQAATRKAIAAKKVTKPSAPRRRK